MRGRAIVAAAAAVIAALSATGAPVSTQAQRIDFGRDVQPLLKQHCVECHSGAEPRGGYRLDRKSGALGGMTRPNIMPRSSESSRLYRRLIGSQFGAQMPPRGPLPLHEIEVIKRWIDDGAEWPDALANETNLAPPDPGAVSPRRADPAIETARP